MDINIVNEAIASDQFLNNDKAINRLVDEYKKHGNLIIAYDFDHTVYDTDGTGASYNQVIELLKVCGDLKFSMTVFTCRPPEEYNMVREYLDDNGIPYDRINEDDPSITFNNNKKIFYNIFLDDRAGLKSAYEILVGTIDRLRGGI